MCWDPQCDCDWEEPKPKKKEIIKEQHAQIERQRDTIKKLENEVAKYKKIINLEEFKRYGELMEQWGVQQRAVRDKTEVALGQMKAALAAILEIPIPAPE